MWTWNPVTSLALDKRFGDWVFLVNVSMGLSVVGDYFSGTRCCFENFPPELSVSGEYDYSTNFF